MIDEQLPPVSNEDLASTTFFNASVLSYLDLSGGPYLADVPLRLPSMSVLRLNGSMALASNATCGDAFPSLVSLENVSFAAVVGGRYDASANASYEALHMLNSDHCSIRGVDARGSSNRAIVHIRGGACSEHQV